MNSWIKQSLGTVSFFISLMGMAHAMIMMVHTSFKLDPYYSLLFVPELGFFAAAMFLLIQLQLTIERDHKLEFYNKYENQDNAEIYRFYEKHPRVRIMKPEEESVLLWVNPNLWLNVTRKDNGTFIISTPPYKNVKREQINAKFEILTTLKDLPSRII